MATPRAAAVPVVDQLTPAVASPPAEDIDGSEYVPEFLVAAVLEAFRTEADRLNDGPVKHPVLTKPADYLQGDPRNDRT